MTLIGESRRTAIGMAAQLARGNVDEYDLLFSGYVNDACDDACGGNCRVVALVALATSAVSLAVFASGNSPEFFTRVAERMAHHGE